VVGASLTAHRIPKNPEWYFHSGFSVFTPRLIDLLVNSEGEKGGSMEKKRNFFVQIGRLGERFTTFLLSLRKIHPTYGY
jgi:hypothetical protein